MPTFMRSDLLASLEGQRQRLDQVRENGGRFATCYGEFSSAGWGEQSLTKVFEFGCEFIERPAVAFGWSLATSPPDPADSPELVETRYPRVSVGVYRWRTNVHSHYTGAWLAFCVDTGSALQEISVDDPNYQLVLSVTFHGVALKSVPLHQLEQL